MSFFQFLKKIPEVRGGGGALDKRTTIRVNPKLLSYAQDLGFTNLTRHVNDWLSDWIMQMEDKKLKRDVFKIDTVYNAEKKKNEEVGR